MDDTSATSKPSAREHLSWLGKFAPCFGVNGSQVSVLAEPSQFYEVLKEEASKATKRIVFASLYLGTGNLEKELVDSVYEAAARHRPGEDKLEVQILLDYTRGSRDSVSSRTMLLPLVRDYTDQVSVSLFHTPGLRGVWKKILPERWNETVGLNHLKVYLFDDNLMMSGANLSDSYFTNRQDRYIIIRRCLPLADFFASLVSTVSSVSFQLQADNTVRLAKGLDHHPYEDADGGEAYMAEAKQRIEKVIDPNTYSTTTPTLPPDECLDNDSKPLSELPIDTWIYPLVQMAPFNISVDDMVTQKLFSHSPEGSAIHLASGYFNLTEHYQNAITNSCQAAIDILTAAPKANGFFGANGVSGAIPSAYTYISQGFLAQVHQQNQQHRVRLHEYQRDGWTFHGKGLWYCPPNCTHPTMTFIGSPNFGYRSVFRDLEAQVAIVTDNGKLQQDLQDEYSQLYSSATMVSMATFDQPERYVPLWVKFVTGWIKAFF